MRILELLEEDCTLSYREIAERLRRSMWSVRDRIDAPIAEANGTSGSTGAPMDLGAALSEIETAIPRDAISAAGPSEPVNASVNAILERPVPLIPLAALSRPSPSRTMSSSTGHP
jgi:hypothetical protein